MELLSPLSGQRPMQPVSGFKPRASGSPIGTGRLQSGAMSGRRRGSSLPPGFGGSLKRGLAACGAASTRPSRFDAGVLISASRCGSVDSRPYSRACRRGGQQPLPWVLSQQHPQIMQPAHGLQPMAIGAMQWAAGPCAPAAWAAQPAPLAWQPNAPVQVWQPAVPGLAASSGALAQGPFLAGGSGPCCAVRLARTHARVAAWIPRPPGMDCPTTCRCSSCLSLCWGVLGQVGENVSAVGAGERPRRGRELRQRWQPPVSVATEQAETQGAPPVHTCHLTSTSRHIILASSFGACFSQIPTTWAVRRTSGQPGCAP